MGFIHKIWQRWSSLRVLPVVQVVQALSLEPEDRWDCLFT
jgi:hypothetical protein